MTELIKDTLMYVAGTLAHNAPVLIFGILAAAAVSVYVDPEKMRKALMKRSGVSIGSSVLLGTFTPFCACGTMAVIVAMMTTSLPWAPVMAFLTSSPLMSPDEFIFYSGIVGFRFAVALTVSSVMIGLGSGIITHMIEKRTRFLNGQARLHSPSQDISCCNEQSVVLPMAAGETFRPGLVTDTGNSQPFLIPQKVPEDSWIEKYKLKALFKVVYELGIKKVLLFFSIFAAIGYMIQQFVPETLIIHYLGSGNKLAVILLAVIGLPLYVSGASAVPLIHTLVEAGASQGALLAFMITGPGTSAGVIAGLVTIMKKRALGLYVIYILAFAILLGYLYDLLLM